MDINTMSARGYGNPKNAGCRDVVKKSKIIM